MVRRTGLTETSESSKWFRVCSTEGLGFPRGGITHLCSQGLEMETDYLDTYHLVPEVPRAQSKQRIKKEDKRTKDSGSVYK